MEQTFIDSIFSTANYAPTQYFKAKIFYNLSEPIARMTRDICEFAMMSAKTAFTGRRAETEFNGLPYTVEHEIFQFVAPGLS